MTTIKSRVSKSDLLVDMTFILFMVILLIAKSLPSLLKVIQL